MTSIQTHGMISAKTRSAGVLLASTAAAAACINPHAEIPNRMFYEAAPRTSVSSVSSTNVTWATAYIGVPTEADFRGIAYYLMSVQEPLGMEIERLFVDHIEDFLD